MAEKEYIERKDLINNRPPQRNPDQTGKEEYNKGYNDGIKAVLSCIEIQPSADVVPVRHGYWIKTSLMFASSNGKHGNVHVCSNCGEQSGVGFKTPYCAICGAKMDGKENNDNENQS